MRTSMIEVSQITDAQAKFNAQMFMRMLLAFDEGKEGWNDPNCKFWKGDFEKEILRRVIFKVTEGVRPGDEADIANYMMMLQYLRTLRASHSEAPHA